MSDRSRRERYIFEWLLKFSTTRETQVSWKLLMLPTLNKKVIWVKFCHKKKKLFVYSQER